MYKQMDLRTGACAAKNPSIASTATTIHSDNGQLTKCVPCSGHTENHEYLILDNLTSPLNRSYYSFHFTNKENLSGVRHLPMVTMLEAELRDPASGASCCPASPAVFNQHSTTFPALVSLGFQDA